MLTQAEKAQRFRALHTRAGAFIIPNPWDLGSAQLLAGLGFEALATTSAGLARALGKADNQIGRDNVLTHVRELAPALDVPLSADLENGFGDAPEACAETIRLSAEAGLVGGSIEDSTRHAEAPQYEVAHAAERVRASVEAARALPFAFTLTARAENFFTGTRDLADTITRLQAYQEAGADVLYAPGLHSVEDIRSVLSSIDRPLNVLLGPQAGLLTLPELAALGVKRVSLGSVLASVASTALLHAAREMLEQGSFGFARNLTPGRELDTIIARGAART